MFSASAEVYDLVYSGFKDYPAETQRLAETLRRLHPDMRSVLDVACGSGRHAELLEQHGFAVDGLDLDPAFVRLAQAKMSAGTVFHGDMTAFDLPRRYDAVICLFSSIAYARTLDNVTRALTCFARHLNPNGVVLVEPWFRPGALQHGRTFMHTAETADVKVCRMSYTRLEPGLSHLCFEYLIARESGIERASEEHTLGLFSNAEMFGCFAEAGLSAEFEEQGLCGRGLYVARETPRP